MTYPMRLLVLLALIALVGCEGCTKDKPPAPTAAKSKPAAPPKPDKPALKPDAPTKAKKAEKTDAEATLERLTNVAAFHAKRAANQPTSWLDLDKVATAHMTRARLLGTYDAYAEADAALVEAFKRASKGGGPVMTRANLNSTLHRFDAAQKDLERFTSGQLRSRSPEQKAAVIAMGGDLLLQQGKLNEAGAAYQEAYAVVPASAHMVRLAHLHRYLGRYAKAEEWLDRAIPVAKREGPFLHAWTLLQRGLLDLERGDLDKADAFYSQAATAFSGWYLIEEHQAEILLLNGKLDAAEALYRDILARSESPEFMEALADTLEAKKKPGEAAQWRAKAAEAYRKDLARFPEATYGHALDHFLAGDDAAFALDLAQKNHAVRPSPEAKIKLAQAFIKSGEDAKARPLIEEAVKTGWSTPELHATAYWIWTRADDAKKAKKHREAAGAVDAGILEELAWMAPSKP